MLKFTVNNRTWLSDLNYKFENILVFSFCNEYIITVIEIVSYINQVLIKAAKLS